MKLLKWRNLHIGAAWRNVNIMTVMGDVRMDGLSDAGSTPARSTIILSNTENVSWACSSYILKNTEESHSF